MKEISILVTHNALIAALGNARYMFNMVNNFLQELGKEPLFDVSMVGLTKEVSLDNGLFTVQVDKEINETKATDLIIIPPMSGIMQNNVGQNRGYIDWIKSQYAKGAEIASLCVGAFILAETGLLDGKDCSTHWQTANEFRKMYPKINLVDEKIITDHNGIYSSGGANSYWNLLVYLVEKYVDRDLAIRTSKYFEIEINRNNQFPFMIFEGNKHHDDKVVSTSQSFIEQEYREKITLELLAQKSNLSSRTFQRRFKKATHFNVSEYIQKVKVEAAKKHLETGSLSINEVMYEVGYNDPKAFRDTFKKVAGVTPIQYRQRYS
jgi:transcriptional regulator GlxA family with amidase domain